MARSPFKGSTAPQAWRMTPGFLSRMAATYSLVHGGAPVTGYGFEGSVAMRCEVTGGGAMHLNDSLGACKEIEFVCALHEQAAAMIS